MNALRDYGENLDELFGQLNLESSSGSSISGVDTKDTNINPYLAHLNNSKGSNEIALGSKDPLVSFVARRVNETQVQKVMVRLHNTSSATKMMNKRDAPGGQRKPVY
jgi:hypothetical protein